MHCPVCGKEFVRGSLVVHRQTQHDVVKGGLGQEVDEEGGDKNSRTFGMVFPAKAGPRPCPVEGCNGRSATQTAMLVHLWHRHVRDTVVIMEEANIPHPWLTL